MKLSRQVSLGTRLGWKSILVFLHVYSFQCCPLSSGDIPLKDCVAYGEVNLDHSKQIR